MELLGRRGSRRRSNGQLRRRVEGSATSHTRVSPGRLVAILPNTSVNIPGEVILVQKSSLIIGDLICIECRVQQRLEGGVVVDSVVDGQQGA